MTSFAWLLWFHRLLFPALLLAATLAAEPSLAPLHRAAFDGDEPAVQALLVQGLDPNAAGPREWTPLHFAAAQGRTAAARTLLERGADANARGQYDLTPLHWAAMQGHADLVPLLLSRGAKVDPRSLHGMTPLMFAADAPVVAALVAARADLRAVDDQGLTALHLARSKEVGKALLDRGADLSARGRDGRSLLEMVVVNTLLPAGLLFYGRRGAGRLRGERTSFEVVVLNVSPHDLEQLELTAESAACRTTLSPATLPRLAPGQRTTVQLALERKPGVDEGEYPLRVGAAAQGAPLGQFELLSVDTTRVATPEDQGMVRLGKVSLKPEVPKVFYLLFAAVPVLAALGWLLRKRR